MKKIIMMIFIFLWFINIANAELVTYTNPTLNDMIYLENLQNQWLITNDSHKDLPLQSNDSVANSFCLYQTWYLVSYDSWYYSNFPWTTTNNWETLNLGFNPFRVFWSQYSYIDEIICDIPAEKIDFWWIANNYDWEINNWDYLQLIVFKDWELLINQDVFSYLILIWLLGALLSTTLVFIVIWWFKLWFYLSSWKVLWKK